MIVINNNDPSFGKIYTHPYPHLIKNVKEKWKYNNIILVVSLLESYHYKKIDYGDIESINYPITDFSIPKVIESFKKCIDYLLTLIKSGNNIAIHCFGGHGRTGTVAAILYAILNNIDGQESLLKIRQLEPNYVETTEQENFVTYFVEYYKKNQT